MYETHTNKHDYLYDWVWVHSTLPGQNYSGRWGAAPLAKGLGFARSGHMGALVTSVPPDARWSLGNCPGHSNYATWVMTVFIYPFRRHNTYTVGHVRREVSCCPMSWDYILFYFIIFGCWWWLFLFLICIWDLGLIIGHTHKNKIKNLMSVQMAQQSFLFQLSGAGQTSCHLVWPMKYKHLLKNNYCKTSITFRSCTCLKFISFLYLRTLWYCPALGSYHLLWLALSWHLAE